jgi:hypothetical protein
MQDLYECLAPSPVRTHRLVYIEKSTLLPSIRKGLADICGKSASYFLGVDHTAECTLRLCKPSTWTSCIRYTAKKQASQILNCTWRSPDCLDSRCPSRQRRVAFSSRASKYYSRPGSWNARLEARHELTSWPFCRLIVTSSPH